MVKIQGHHEIKVAKKDKPKLKIFVDMDGVVADWLTSACKICNIDLKDPDIRSKLKKPGAEVQDILPDKEIFDKLANRGKDFYVKLELLPWAKRLYNALDDLGNICFLTSPGSRMPMSAYAAAGKTEWVDKHFPNASLLIGYDKHFCASKDAILVDDSLKKTKKFSKHGGHVFIFPNPLTIEDGDVKIEDVLDEVCEKVLSIR